MVEISIGGCGEFESSEADIIESFIVYTESFICVLHQLMDREGGIVRFHNSVRHLGRRNNRVGVHDPVGVFLSDLGDEKCSHSRSSSSSERMCQLESLETVTVFCFFPDHIKD